MLYMINDEVSFKHTNKIRLWNTMRQAGVITGQMFKVNVKKMTSSESTGIYKTYKYIPVWTLCLLLVYIIRNKTRYAYRRSDENADDSACTVCPNSFVRMDKNVVICFEIQPFVINFTVIMVHVYLKSRMKKSYSS